MAGLLGEHAEGYDDNASVFLFVLASSGIGEVKEHTLVSVILLLGSASSGTSSSSSSGTGGGSASLGCASCCSSSRLALELAGGFLEEVHYCGGCVVRVFFVLRV